MGHAVAQFPRQIWDGDSVCPERQGRISDRDPNSQDWDQIVVELRATQAKVLELETRNAHPLSGSNANVRIGCFGCPVDLGSYSVVGLGFRPKSVKFWVSKIPGETYPWNFCCCQGMMDAFGNQNSMTWMGSWSNLFHGDSRTDLCIYTVNNTGLSQVTGSFVSMDADGFTINFLASNTLYMVRWEAIG
jgi:hypothetical protein